jgi:hypothetical protein
MDDMLLLLLFMSMGWDNVCELWPLFILQVIYEYGEPRWNDIDRENPKNWDRSLSQCHSVHHNSHKHIPDLRGDRPATNRPSRVQA